MTHRDPSNVAGNRKAARDAPRGPLRVGKVALTTTSATGALFAASIAFPVKTGLNPCERAGVAIASPANSAARPLPRQWTPHGILNGGPSLRRPSADASWRRMTGALRPQPQVSVPLPAFPCSPQIRIAFRRHPSNRRGGGSVWDQRPRRTVSWRSFEGNASSAQSEAPNWPRWPCGRAGGGSRTSGPAGLRAARA
jgi:hypothetical protein